MKYCLSLLLICSLSSISYCQLEVLWTTAYDGIRYAGINNIILTSDNSYVIAGEVMREDEPNESYCGNLVKFNDEGEMEWETFLSRESLFIPYGAIETSDGGFAVTGDQACFMGPPFVVKTNSEGEIEWTRTYDVGLLCDILETEDGGFIIAGRQDNAGIIKKIDNQGEVIWSNQYSVEDQYIRITSVINSNESGYTLLIEISYPEDSGSFLIFTNSEGDSTASWTYEGEANFRIKTIELLPDEGYMLTGSYINDHWPYSPVVVIIDFEGNITSEVQFNFDFIWSWRPGSIIRTHDDGYALGSSSSPNDNRDFHLIKTDANGEITWQGTYGTEDNEGVWCILQNAEGDFILAGVVDPIDEPFESSGEDWLIVKARYDSANVIDSPELLPGDYALFSAYPNPFNSTTTIGYSLPYATEVSLNLYNLSGQRVETLVSGRMQAGVKHVRFEAGDLASGLYFVQLKANNKAFTHKLMLIR